MPFSDRIEAGKQLAEKLTKYKRNAIILAIPRGGIEVGYAIAKQLNCALQIVVSKKIPYPGQPEIAIGAVCNDVVSLDKHLINAHNISDAYVKEQIASLQEKIKQRYAKLTSKKTFPELKNKIVIVTDDGIATGHTFFAAIDFIKTKNPKKIIAAIPVGPQESIEALTQAVDELIILEKPAFFMAVGEFYTDFEQLTDDDVLKYLKLANT